MPTTDPRVDAYIAKAPEFARPILTRLRELAHEGCPDCEETLKWNAPTFMHNGIVFIMAAFKKHCAVNFWHGTSFLTEEEREGRLGHIEQLDDLPAKKVFLGYMKTVMAMNAGKGSDAGAVKKRAPKPRAEIVASDEFLTALRKSRKAQAVYDAFPPSHRREYVQWIAEAKTDATRDKRIAQAVEWIAEGKQRNWKYL